MKPLTIEELKSLEIGDWVWLVDLKSGVNTGYEKKEEEFNEYADFSNYGKTWLAYKNKEQAEAKGEIVDIEDTFCCAMVGTTEQGEKYVSLEDYKHDIHKLGNIIKEYRRKLESGEMIDTTKYFYEKEKKPNGEYRYLICKYDTVSKGIYDFCNTLSEAERRLEELKGD